jgi:phosphopantothenoylcysteine synthetase/decarboxylase
VLVSVVKNFIMSQKTGKFTGLPPTVEEVQRKKKLEAIIAKQVKGAQKGQAMEQEWNEDNEDEDEDDDDEDYKEEL